MPTPPSLASDCLNALRGLFMGAADIIPGVSGGTVALLVGIYPRLLTAISHFDARLVRLLATRRWLDAARHVDLRFLVALGIGIGTGILTLAGLLHYLLDHHRAETLAAFFGLILASSILVARMANPTSGEQRVRCIMFGIAAAVFAAWLVSGSYLQPRDSLLYVFGSGAIAICAMILPGISGAYILVLLGEYEAITGILHRLKAREITSDDAVTLVVFASGCAIGLLAFSKVLRALLARFHSETMAVLGGFMIGSLLKVWPFQQAATAGEEITKTTVTHPVWPEELSQHVLVCSAIAISACGLVIVADRIAHMRGKGKVAK